MMMPLNQESHEFALYFPNIEKARRLNEPEIVDLSDKELYRRIAKILRLEKDDFITLFNQEVHARCKILAIQKDKLSLLIEQYQLNKRLNPPILWLLPLLKKEAFEECLYTLTEMGIQEIQPITTRKSQQIAPYIKSERTENILIAAAEQSKQFILPSMEPIKSLEKALESLDKDSSLRIFFDATGLPMFDFIQKIKIQDMPTKIVCAIGPEGDLTETEKQLLKDYNFQFCQLTPTILRAKQALTVATGIFRSML